MIFKKPYAFFIKYFRLINFILTALFTLFMVDLWKLHGAINKLSSGSTANYSSLSNFVGFKIYLLMFFIAIILAIMIVLLKRKEKPFNDYLFGLLYIGILLIYILSVSSMFLSIDESIVEIATLKLYRDLSLIVIFPFAYFIVKYLLIVIGFNIKKFNFSKDLMELKQDEKDSEEVEIIFDKNTYKYKRKFRKMLREFKYYFQENKFIFTIIIGVLLIAGVIFLLSLNIFNSNKVVLKEKFSMANFKASVNKVYETEYNLNNRIIKDDFKFVIANMTITNNGESQNFDFKKIRLFYGKESVYPNDYFNKYFYDLGIPYSSTVLKSGKTYNYIFIFKVPKSYKSKKYTLKFYDGIEYGEEEANAKYMILKTKAKKLNKKSSEQSCSLNQRITFDKGNYGNSYITVNGYKINNNFIVEEDKYKKVIKPKDVNSSVLELEYDLSLDQKYDISKYFENEDDFISNYISIEYTSNNKTKELYDLSIIKTNIKNKTYISIPYSVVNASNINIKFNFRTKTLIYKYK